MVARAFFKAIGQLTTQQISAAFVRLGYLGRQQAAELINRTDQEVADALSWLTDMQAVLGDRNPSPSSCPVPQSTSGPTHFGCPLVCSEDKKGLAAFGQPTLGARLFAVNTKKVLPRKRISGYLDTNPRHDYNPIAKKLRQAGEHSMSQWTPYNGAPNKTCTEIPHN